MPSRLTGSKQLWHPYTPVQGALPEIEIKRARGVYLYTTDGRKLIDGISSWWVNVHGHGTRWQADLMKKQTRKLDHILFAGLVHDEARQLARALLPLLPGKQEHMFFSDDGSTAVEVAIKMALQHWHNQGIKRTKLIALRGAYHGDTFGAMSVSDRGIFTRPFHKQLFDVEFIDFPQHENALKQFEKLIRRKDIAAFIYEPLLQGAAGMRVYEPEMLNSLLRLARENGVLAIADEILTGFYRTGTMFASEQHDEKPDIVCLSKAISGGLLAMGVTTCNAKVFKPFDSPDPMHTFYHGHSYTANPITCAMAVESLRRLQKPAMQQNISNLCNAQKEFIESVKSHPALRSARHLGTVAAIELVTPEETTYLNEARAKVFNFFLERDILLRPLGNVVYFLPPYVISKRECNKVHEAMRALLEAWPL